MTLDVSAVDYLAKMAVLREKLIGPYRELTRAINLTTILRQSTGTLSIPHAISNRRDSLSISRFCKRAASARARADAQVSSRDRKCEILPEALALDGKVCGWRARTRRFIKYGRSQPRLRQRG